MKLSPEKAQVLPAYSPIALPNNRLRYVAVMRVVETVLGTWQADLRHGLHGKYLDSH